MSLATLDAYRTVALPWSDSAARAAVARAAFVLTVGGVARVVALAGKDDDGDDLVRVAPLDVERARPHFPNPTDAFVRVRDVRVLEPK